MVKLGKYEYDLIRFESEPEGIEELISESHNPKLESIFKQIDVLSMFRFNDELPFYLGDQAIKAFNYALEKGFNTFTDVHKQFVFGKPEIDIFVEANLEYLKVETQGKEFYTPRNISGASFESVPVTFITQKDYILGNEESLQKESSELKNKTVTILKKENKDENIHFKLFALDKSLKVTALIEPFKDKERLETEVLYQTMNITSQYLTIPFILSNFLKKATIGKEGLIDGSSYLFLQQMTSSVLGTTLLNNYYQELGLNFSFKPTNFASKNNSWALKSEQLLFDSKGSLEKCFELVKKEIDLTLETLKRD